MFKPHVNRRSVAVPLCYLLALTLLVGSFSAFTYSRSVAATNDRPSMPGEPIRLIESKEEPSEMGVQHLSTKIEVNPGFLNPVLFKQGDSIILNVDEDLQGTITHVEIDINSVYSLRGTIEGCHFGYFIITVKDRMMTATVARPTRGETYAISYRGSIGEHFLEKGHNVPSDQQSDYVMLSDVASSDNLESMSDPSATADIDILFLYTPAAKEYADTWMAGIESVILSKLAHAQLVMDNSQVGVRLHRAHSQLINYVESGVPSIDFIRLKEVDGYMDEAHAIRNQCGADVVILLNLSTSHSISTNSENSIRYSNGAYAFGVIGVQSPDWSLDLARSLGGIMGCNRSRNQTTSPAPPEGGLFPYSTGWRWTGSNGFGYVSVMTYQEGHTLVPIFSNPDVLHQGVPTGSYNGPYAPADNARSIREIKHTIAQYRPRVTGNITAVGALADIQVMSGTDRQSLPLPGVVSVTIDENKKRVLRVTWDNGTPEYNGLNPRNYVFSGFITLEEGITNTGNLKAAVKVEVALHFTYTISGGKATITGYSSVGPKDVIIPATLGGYPVEVIGAGAFTGRSLKTVIIPDTVKHLRDSAFHYNNLSEILIPENVISIGMNAFSSNKLTSVHIPDTVISIGPSAFAQNRLSSVTLSSNLTSVDGFSFNNIASIIIPPGVTSIADNAFQSNLLTSVIIPPTVTSIGKYAFRHNTLTSLTMGNLVSHIGHYAFEYNQLTHISIPPCLASIGTSVFASNRLTSVSIPPTVKSIGPYAFSNNSLTSVEIPTSLTVIPQNAFKNNLLSSVTIPDTVTLIESSAFESNLLTQVSIPQSVTAIHNSAFRHNILTSVTLGDNVTTIGGYAFHSNRLTSIEIPATVTVIWSNAFSKNQLGSVTIPASVQTIGDAAFLSNLLTSVTISPGVTTIGRDAFRDNKLTSVTLPASLTKIELSTFQDNQLTEITIPSTVKDIGSRAFKGNQLTSINIATGVTTIGSEAFANNLLTTVALPDSLTDVGSSAFSSNKIADVSIPTSVITIGSSAFSKNSLGSVVIPESVTSIGPNAFSYNQLTSVIIPSSVTSIGSEAFSDNLLTSVTITHGVTSIGNGAFSNNLLTSLTIPSSVTSLGERAFINNQLVSVAIPNSLTTISRQAFANNKLASVLIPDSVTRIGEFAFNANLLSQLVIPESVTNIDSSAFSSNSLKLLLIGDGVKSIAAQAFSGNQLSSVIIPDSVTTLGYLAFQNNHLISVTIGSGVTSIANGAFQNNNLSSLSIPSHVKTIDNWAFAHNQLTSILMPGVTNIGTSAFAYNQLVTVSIPISVTSIKSNAFAYNQLTAVRIENPNVQIMDHAFTWNSKDLVFYGKSGSTAESYAKKFKHDFLPDKAALPVAIPFAGDVAMGTEVSLTTITAGAAIFYTLDGSDPTTSSTRYETPIPITVDVTLKAIAVMPDFLNSDILIAQYYVSVEITFRDHDGATIKQHTVRRGQEATPPPDPYRTGYTFTGWDKPFDEVSTDLVVTAQYRPNQYTITFVSNGGSGVEAITADYNATIVPPPSPHLAGLSFAGWYKDEDLNRRWCFTADTVPLDGTTLYARWAVLGTVTGIVSDLLGPLPQATVTALQGGAIVAQSITNAAGEYVLDLPPDHHVLIFTKERHIKLSQNSTVVSAHHEVLDGTIALLGDVNLDGFVNAADIVPVNRHALGIELITNPLALLAADVNEDGYTNAADIVPINRHALGIQLIE